MSPHGRIGDINRLTPRRPARGRRNALSATLFAVFAALTSAAARAEDADSQAWALFTLNARTPDGVRFYAEVQPRLGENYTRGTQLLVRPAVGYQVNRTFSVWLGYAWAPAFTPRYTNEHRPFQQLLWEDRLPGTRTSVINRFRLEERFIDRAGGTSLRVRHLLRFVKPLDAKNRWLAIASDELFWNLNDTDNGPVSGFDQNRFYVAGGYNVNPQTRVELGYQLVNIDAPRGRPNRRLDVAMLMVNYNL